MASLVIKSWFVHAKPQNSREASARSQHSDEVPESCITTREEVPLWKRWLQHRAAIIRPSLIAIKGTADNLIDVHLVDASCIRCDAHVDSVEVPRRGKCRKIDSGSSPSKLSARTVWRDREFDFQRSSDMKVQQAARFACDFTHANHGAQSLYPFISTLQLVIRVAYMIGFGYKC